MTGLSSETVKSFTAALGLPTISASFGQEQDLIKWRNIDEDQKKYLIQINPPTDIIPEIIRDIVIRQNITNAAILYDSVFVMEHKYKSLLQDIATRNVITAIDVTNQEQQILKLQDMNLVNFFILGRLETVTQVLKNASANGLFNAKFAWHVITPNSENIACECDDGRVLHVKPIEDSSFKERFESIQRSFNLDEPKIVSAFYFDFALQSFLAIG
ncbi:hypothetical protein HHI36_013378 [Cryptolaemus montrouzieri]|uniref:Uncharacterized protein n=1 Tax=Cryptolaemus montrouzieri TaxID=559131 RepID=A0ABD2NI16_9CUCU